MAVVLPSCHKCGDPNCAGFCGAPVEPSPYFYEAEADGARVRLGFATLAELKAYVENPWGSKTEPAPPEKAGVQRRCTVDEIARQWAQPPSEKMYWDEANLMFTAKPPEKSEPPEPPRPQFPPFGVGELVSFQGRIGVIRLIRPGGVCEIAMDEGVFLADISSLSKAMTCEAALPPPALPPELQPEPKPDPVRAELDRRFGWRA